ncbi:hypothetical protein DFH06DRAFT_525178 [Mycena polygramma]|nr:hypothetical protein DFH06DRAFT_525178 [Mycena polygramma]
MPVIHPPFTDLPEGVVLTDAMSYAVLHEHPTWFLDAKDFVTLKPHPDSSSAVETPLLYPREHQPPRPRRTGRVLRCTFCPRTWSTVNAKSMWVRHVRERHGVALSKDIDRPDRLDTKLKSRSRPKSKANRKFTTTAAEPLLPAREDSAPAPAQSQAHDEMDVDEDSCKPTSDQGGLRVPENDVTVMSSVFVQLRIPPLTL